MFKTGWYGGALASLLLLLTPAAEAHWLEDFVTAKGGCGPHVTVLHMGLDAAKTQLIDTKNVSTPMYGKPLIQWSDEDIAAAIRTYKDCDAQLHNSVIEYCMRVGSRTRQWCEEKNVPGIGIKAAQRFEYDLRDTVVLARNLDAQRQSLNGAQAQHDREAAEAAARQSELENSKPSGLTNQPEATRASEVANVTLQLNVADYTKWRPVFDKYKPIREKIGITSERVFRNADEPNQVLVWWETRDANKFLEALGSDEVKNYMEEAGVLGPSKIKIVQ